MNTAVHFSSAEQDWSTPQWLFDQLHAEFNFTLDVCADETNAKCVQYYDEEINGLLQQWVGVCWMNPPYGRDIGQWVCAAFHAAEAGSTVVCLLPARTDTKWWAAYVMKSWEVRLISGRLKFSGHKNSAPFPSCIVVFKGGARERMLRPLPFFYCVRCQP